MSFDALKTEVQSLPAEERRKLLAFMVVLEDGDRADYRDKLARKIDDNSPDRWLTADQVEQKLGLSGESK